MSNGKCMSEILFLLVFLCRNICVKYSDGASVILLVMQILRNHSKCPYFVVMQNIYLDTWPS